ncbi:MFS transporter [Liquorilactobacillus mali]|uniref:MFS transporter n=1 Tax=Liquorilactobacillus mali TaxID=1618 RepID=UPI0026501CCA|nr:MFS transporter [Liquorilactobacillus mali]MDN7145926.1 MFS transporter [Liquorilactobacillus mali]
MADRLGFINVLRLSFTILPVILLLFPLIKNPILALLFLIPLGLIVFTPYSSMVLLGQAYLPQNMGLASGVTLGLAVSVGGIASPILGSLADTYGLSMVLYTLPIIALVPLIVSYLLKKQHRSI